MAIGVRPLSPAIGAEITGIDLARPLDEATVRAIHALWLKHIVLLFRDQALTQADLLRATACFGTPGKVARPKAFQPKGYAQVREGIMLISNIREDGEPIGALPDGEMMFHHDMLHAEIPHKATLLYAVEVPSRGGETLFANGYAAYETLPEAVRAPLEGRTARHHYNYGSTQKGDGRGVEAFSEAVHPVFRTHDETGRKAVYVDRLMTEAVVGLERAESEALLQRVYDHAERPEFVYAHAWRKGDLLIWDNRCSMHARTDFPATERRLLWRTTVVADEAPR